MAGQKIGSSTLAIVVGIVLAAVAGIFNITAGIIVFIIYFLLSTKILAEWKKSPILTLGRYSGIYGPGTFFILPLIQSVPYIFDLRTASNTFSAEKTLTSDNVTVDVDAIMFFKIEDPEKAALQVSSLNDSVTLAAQTALRDVIGQVELSRMIHGRAEIADDVKTIIDERVLPWGVNVISVEIRDVKIPPDLQDAMAKVAIASREKDARVVLAESEKLAAQQMVDAASMYTNNPYAMQLRALNIMYEIGISGQNTLIFVPTDSKGIGMPTPIGVFGASDLMSGKISHIVPKPQNTDSSAATVPSDKKKATKS